MALSMNGAKGPSSAEINVTPLIDVLLVLLIIFMVVVPSAPLGLGARVPEPGRSIAAALPEGPVEAAGDSSRPVYRVDGVAVEAVQVSARLIERMSGRSGRCWCGRARGWTAETAGMLRPGMER